ncbi:MAG: hypothetical protein ABSD38_35275, partial [Syntrophorhabdales bacterium]
MMFSNACSVTGLYSPLHARFANLGTDESGRGKSPWSFTRSPGGVVRPPGDHYRLVLINAMAGIDALFYHFALLQLIDTYFIHTL